jgi:putative addiction module antidote
MVAKLRKIGNSLGTTFSQELLAKAGLSEGDELDIVASNGEIRIRALTNIVVEFSEHEAKALANGDFSSKHGDAALTKIRRALASRE